MGEYAKFEGKEIKIGTCEDMYYLRYNQRYMVDPLPNSLNPHAKDTVTVIRFRFPWPDEDNLPPGSAKFEPFRYLDIPGATIPERIEHYSVQFSAPNGYLVSLPCPEGPQTLKLTIHRNGYGGKVHLIQQKQLADGRLVPVLQCGGCKTAWRVEDEEEIKQLADLVRARKDCSEYFGKIADRIENKS